MKKILLLIAVALTITFNAKAQYFTMSIDGTVVGDTTILYSETAGENHINFYGVFTNTTDHEVVAKIVRRYISMIDSSYIMYCWGGICGPETMDTSYTTQTIQAGLSSGDYDFEAKYYYNAETAFGVSIVEYEIYNINNPEEKQIFVIKYDNSIDNIDENILKDTWVSELYPNPSSSVVNIDYNFPVGVKKAEVKIVNLVGSVVMEKNLDAKASRQGINISELNSGIYFYSLFLNEEIYSTKKLIVK